MTYSRRMISRRRAAKVGLLAGGGSAPALATAADRGALVPAVPPAAAADQRHPRARRARGPGRDPPRPLGRAPRPAPRAGHDLWFGQGFCHGQDRLWQMDLYRRIGSGRLSEIAGAAGLPVDRFMRTLGLRRAAEREAAALDAGAARPARAPSAPGVNAAAARARALPVRVPAPAAARSSRSRRSTSSPWQAPLLRPLDQLGARAAARRHDARARARARRAARPGLSRPTTRAHPGRAGAATGWRSSSRSRGARRDRAGGRGHRLQQLGGRAARSARPGGRSWPATRTSRRACRDRLPGRPQPRATASAAAPRSPGCRGSEWARTTTSPGRSPTRWPTSRTSSSSGSTATATSSRASGCRSRSSRRRSWSRAARPGACSRARDPPRPDRQRGARRRRRRAAGAALGRARRADGSPRQCSSCLDVDRGPELVAVLERAHVAPVSNLVWADRHGSIGYKMVGRLPLRRGGCPDLPKPGWTGEYEWEGMVPLRGAAGGRSTPSAASWSRPTTGSSATTIPHHITSDWLDGYRARRIEELLQRSATSTTSTSFEAMQTDMLSIPGLEAARRLGRLSPRGQRELRAIERLRSWDGGSARTRSPASIYQAFLLRLGARGRPRRDRRPRPVRALARPRRQRLHRPRHLAMALALPPARPLGGGRRGADRAPLGRARARRARGALDDLGDRFGPDPEGWRWGRVHELVFPHPLGDANPCSPAPQPPARGRRRPGDRQPGRLRPQRPLPRGLGAVLADGRRPGRARALALADVHRAVRPPGEPPLRRPPGGLARGPHPADGRRGAVARARARAAPRRAPSCRAGRRSR